MRWEGKVAPPPLALGNSRDQEFLTPVLGSGARACLSMASQDVYIRRLLEDSGRLGTLTQEGAKPW